MITELKKKKNHYNINNKARLGYKDTEETKAKRIEAQKKYYANNPRLGEKAARWNGGIRRDTKGYILIYKPEHPFCSNKCIVLQHRLVMEESLGRYLRPKEVVHHINGNVSDNRIENLELFDGIGKHISYHFKLRREEKC